MARTFLIKFYRMVQNARVTGFWVIKVKPTEGGVGGEGGGGWEGNYPPFTQIRVKSVFWEKTKKHFSQFSYYGWCHQEINDDVRKVRFIISWKSIWSICIYLYVYIYIYIYIYIYKWMNEGIKKTLIYKYATSSFMLMQSSGIHCTILLWSKVK